MTKPALSISKWFPTLALALLGLGVAGGGVAFAHGYKQKTIAIVHPWTRESAKDTRKASIGLKIENTSRKADRLLKAESAAAEHVDLQTDAGVALEEGIVIPGEQSVVLKPGGLHIELTGLKKPLVPYDTLPVTLILQNAGRIKIDVLVEEASP